MRFLLAAILSLAGGFIIFRIDSSKGWDDSGITAGMLFLLSAFCGFISPRRFWLWALFAGLWIPLNGILKTTNFLFLLILLIPFAGSLAGLAIAGLLTKRKDKI